MREHVTSTVFIIEKESILLVYHKKLNVWLPPGGHVQSHETPADAAHREVREEVGLDIELILQENLWIETREASSFARPYLCLLENIPATQNFPAHKNVDFIYLARCFFSSKMPVCDGEEISNSRWFSRDEVLQLEENKEIFPNVKQILVHIFSRIVDGDVVTLREE